MDVLKEIGNIGAGNATTAIAGMLGTTMKMEVPRVLLMDATKLGDAICPEEETIVGIFLEVTNDISGSSHEASGSTLSGKQANGQTTGL